MSSHRLAPAPAPPTAALAPEQALHRLLGRLTASCDRFVGSERLKAAVRAAGLGLDAARPDPWSWLEDAGRRVGLRVRRLELDWQAALDLLGTGPVVGRSAGGWLLLLDGGPGGVRLWSAADDVEETVPLTVLQARLAGEGGGDVVCCAVVEPQTPASTRERAQPTPPFARLVELVAPERRDLKALVVFAGVVGLLNLATPVAVEALVNTVAFVGLLQPIFVLAVVLAVCLGFAAALRALEAFVVELLQRRVFVRVATDLAYRLPRVRRDAFDGIHGPELVNRFFDVATVQKVGSKLLLDGVTAVLSAAIGLLVLAFYHPLLLAFDVVLLAALAVIVFVMGRGAVRSAVKESSAKFAVADWLEELVRHPGAFHLACGRELALDHADTLAHTYLERRRGHYRIVFRQLAGALALQVVTSALLLGLGGWLVKLGELTLGQLVASWLIVSLVLAAVAKLGRELESVYDLLAAVDKLGVLFDLPLEDEGGEEPLPKAGPAALRLTDVSYRWSSGAAAFSGLDVAIAPGERVALLGPSGAGKSTLLELAQGLRPCATGRIELDGVDLRSLRLRSLRPLVGLARPGEVIAASVAENVRLGRPLSLEQVQQALQAVGLWETVQQLPEGLETRLASFGRPLSDGQANLLALARVIVGQPRLLLVDGLLDGLDAAALDRALEALTSAGAWTLVVATRREEIARRLGRTLRWTATGLQEAA